MTDDPKHILDDEVFAEFSGLRTHELDRSTSERIRRRARGAFERNARAEATWWTAATRLYNRLEPVMALGVAAVYLQWAFESVIALYQ